MFSLENDRQDYGRLLIPPVGYEVEMAVGTTYSLDLEALTLAAISLGIGAETDSMFKDNPISMLNAIRKVTDRVVLFYESGHLQIPIDSKNNKLFQLLEKVTIPVALPAILTNQINPSSQSNQQDQLNQKTSGNYPSFHPKTWLLCYRHIETKARKYRFIVMSRNLTFDRSWDVVVSFEGEKTDSPQEISEPIAHFLHFLKLQTISEESTQILETLQKDILDVKFDIGDFSGVEFMPIGVRYQGDTEENRNVGKDGNGGYNGYDIESDQWLAGGKNSIPFHEVVIISPFISKGIISRFNDERRRLRITSPCERTLITRLSELDKLDNESAGNFKIYTVKDEVIDGESEISEDSSNSSDRSDINKQDIHAKVLMFFRREMPSCLYLGSMNASHNGFYRNIEFDVRLWCKNSMFGPSRFLEDIGLYSSGSPFQQRDLSESIPPEHENKTVEMALKRLCRSNAHGVVIKHKALKGEYKDNSKYTGLENGVDKGKDNVSYESKENEDLYTVKLHFNPDMIAPGITIAPITGKYAPIPLEAVIQFSNIPLIEITEYYRIFIPDQEGTPHISIIQIPLEGIPSERDRLICNRVIDTKNKLYEYLSLILSDDKILALLESKDVLSGDNKFQFKTNHTPAIYEKLLEASLHHRERFREINDIIQMLPAESEIVSEFNKLYKTFRKALNLKDKQP